MKSVEDRIWALEQQVKLLEQKLTKASVSPVARRGGPLAGPPGQRSDRTPEGTNWDRVKQSFPGFKDCAKSRQAYEKHRAALGDDLAKEGCESVLKELKNVQFFTASNLVARGYSQAEAAAMIYYLKLYNLCVWIDGKGLTRISARSA